MFWHRDVIDCVVPDQHELLRLWRQAHPERTSGGERITDALDHEWLASHIELTGAEIKAAALAAAFEARAAGGGRTPRRGLQGRRRGLSKRGGRTAHATRPGPPVREVRG